MRCLFTDPRPCTVRVYCIIILTYHIHSLIGSVKLILTSMDRIQSVVELVVEFMSQGEDEHVS